MTIDEFIQYTKQELKLLDEGVIRADVAASWIAHYVGKLNKNDGDDFA